MKRSREPPGTIPRTARLNQLLQEIVAEEIERLDDERLGFFTVVGGRGRSRPAPRRRLVHDAGSATTRTPTADAAGRRRSTSTGPACRRAIGRQARMQAHARAGVPARRRSIRPGRSASSGSCATSATTRRRAA